MERETKVEEGVTSKNEASITVEGQNEAKVPPDDSETPDNNAQDGVRIAEAMTLSWSRSSLIIVYIR